MLESDGSAGFYVTYMVNGVEQRVHMTREDDFVHRYSEYHKEEDNSQYWLWSPVNSFTFGYFDVGGWRADEFEIAPDGTESTTNIWRGHIVYGTPTEVMPVAGTATYDGRMRANGWKTGGQDRIYAIMELTRISAIVR